MILNFFRFRLFLMKVMSKIKIMNKLMIKINNNYKKVQIKKLVSKK